MSRLPSAIEITVDEKRLRRLFFEIIEIDSPTFEERQMIDYLDEKLSALGFTVQIDQAHKSFDGSVGNLIASLAGRPDKPPIFYNCHVDTVEPGRGIEPIEKDGVIMSAGETVLGADDKAGVAALLEMAHIITAGQPDHGHIDIIFTVAEEKGLLGAKHLNWELVRGEYGFVLDAAGPVGDVTITAPWQNTFTALFHGKAAHAGVSPEAGVSAVQAAARAVETMPLGRRDKETTANIGTIEGGRAINIIPDRAEIKGEARSLSVTKLNRQTDRMVQATELAAKTYGATVDIEVKREYDGFNLSKKDPVVRWAANALDLIGVKPSHVSTGGGSDTNVFNARGVPTVNLGAGYLGPHTVDESVSVQELVLMAKTAVAIAYTVA